MTSSHCAHSVDAGAGASVGLGADAAGASDAACVTGSGAGMPGALVAIGAAEGSDPVAGVAVRAELDALAS